MRVLAARFPDRERASAALDALQRRLRLAEEELAIAPLGTPGEGAKGDQTLLAGHFRDDQTPLVRMLVVSLGGEVVADVDEQWTQPRPSLPSPSGGHGRTTPERTYGRRRERDGQPLSR